MHARALRRLGLVVMAIATLGGCVVTDYGSYTGSYYPGGYAYPGYVYRIPGEFGRVWRFLGWRGAWPLAWMARQEQLAQSPVWMARLTGQLARRRGWTASRPPGLAPVRIGMWRHYQKNKLVAFAVGLCFAGSVQAQMPQDHLTRQRSHQKQLDLSRDRIRTATAAKPGTVTCRTRLAVAPATTSAPGRSVAARMTCARSSRGHLSSDRSLPHRFEGKNRLELRPAGPPSRHGWPVPALTAQELANDGAVRGIRPASRQIIAASSSGSSALKRRSHRIARRRFTSYVERASLPPQ